MQGHLQSIEEPSLVAPCTENVSYKSSTGGDVSRQHDSVARRDNVIMRCHDGVTRRGGGLQWHATMTTTCNGGVQQLHEKRLGFKRGTKGKHKREGQVVFIKLSFCNKVQIFLEIAIRPFGSFNDITWAVLKALHLIWGYLNMDHIKRLNYRQGPKSHISKMGMTINGDDLGSCHRWRGTTQLLIHRFM